MATINSSTNLTDGSSGYYAQLIPIAVLIAFVNGVVFVLYAKDKHLRTPANYLLFSLAVCDFMTGLINIPLFIIVFTRVFAPQPGKIFGFFVVVLHNMVIVSVVYHIFLTTAERYFSIVHPFRHRWKITKGTVLKIILAIWLAAIVIAFLPIVWFHRFIYFQENISSVTLQIQTGHNIFCMVFVFLLPYTVMVYLQVIMFRNIRRRSFKFGKQERLSCTAVNRKVNSMKRSLIIFALMAFFYAVCWFPWYVVSLLINLWFPLSYEAQIVLSKFAHTFVIIRYYASIVNPALYIFLKRDFFASLKSIVLRRTPKRTNNSQATSLITERTVNREYALGLLTGQDKEAL